MRLAIFTPSTNAYSETFIHAHIDLLEGEKIVYSSGRVPRVLDGRPLAIAPGAISKIGKKVLRKVGVNLWTEDEKNLLTSLKLTQPDVVLSEYGTTAAESYKVLKQLNIPLVVHFHGFDASEKGTIEKYAERYKEMFQYASRVIGVSAVMCKKLQELGCPPSKIVHTCCGPAEDFFNVINAPKKGQFLAVGRFVEKKAMHLTILAFYKLWTQHPDAVLKVAGDGHAKLICMDIVNGLGMGHAVQFLGAQTHDQIVKLMSESICFVQHSRIAENGDMEGTPVAVLEAQAAGLPVVATQHAGIPDVVLNGTTGILVPEGDVDQMAAAMLEMIENPNKAISFGNAGKERVRNNFSMETHIGIVQAAINFAANNK